MTTVLNPPQVAGEERFVLRKVTWETYEQLLKNYESFSAPRLTYDGGDLEIISPSKRPRWLYGVRQRIRSIDQLRDR